MLYCSRKAANEISIGYYNTWTEEIFDESEIDGANTSNENAITDDSDSELSPGHESSIDIGASSRGLDFMSSAGPQIEFGYDTASDEEYDEEEEDDESAEDTDDASSLANNGQKRMTSPLKRGLVCRKSFLLLLMTASDVHSYPISLGRCIKRSADYLRINNVVGQTRAT